MRAFLFLPFLCSLSIASSQSPPASTFRHLTASPGVQSRLDLHGVSSYLASDLESFVAHSSFFDEETTKIIDEAKKGDEETRRQRREARQTTLGPDDALPADEAPAVSLPFLVCSFSGVPGVGRRADVSSSFFGASPLTQVLYNGDDASCFVVVATAEDAEKAASHLAVQPLLPSMKLPKGFSQSQRDGALREVDEFRVFLCRGQQGEDEREGRQELADKIQTGLRTNGGPLSSSSSSSSCQSLISLSSAVQISASASSPYLFLSGLLPFNADVSLEQCVKDVLLAVAKDGAVCNVVPVAVMKTSNHEAKWITQSGACRTEGGTTGVGGDCSSSYLSAPSSSTGVLSSLVSTPFYANGITGVSQIVQVSDTGLDVDHNFFNDNACLVPRDKSGVFNKSCRKVIQYYAYGDSVDEYEGHGTHVVGSIVGRRTLTGADVPTDKTAGGTVDEGMARDAKVAFYDTGMPGEVLTFPQELADMLQVGYNAGARVHSASWGANSNVYTYSDQDFDSFMYDHDDMLIVVAAGNSGNDRDRTTFNIAGSIGTPGTAKNIVSVGATQSGPTDTAPYLNGNTPNKGYQHLASFSSRGPTSDGRRKPDVCAPGYHISSSAADMNTFGGEAV